MIRSKNENRKHGRRFNRNQRSFRKQLTIKQTYRSYSLAFKTMYIQFCNKANSCAYWLLNNTLWYGTETFDFQSETRSRPSYVSTRPRRLETTSRDGDYIPALLIKCFKSICSMFSALMLLFGWQEGSGP